MDSIVGKPLPAFKVNACTGGEFSTVESNAFKGKWTVLLFYPLDFTFVCPTEILAYDGAADRFKKLNAQVFGASVDSHFTHRVYLKTPRSEGGIEGVKMTLLADLGGNVARSLGILNDGGLALRGLFVIDPDLVVQHATINNLAVGRNVDETLRMIEAFQFTKANGEVCPANWKPGAKSMKPTFDGLKDYMKAAK
ncbi:MAG TPA: peroxiredoxin [Planctomycetota bacterium]|nr:peroxiredoxin [Planctomycetota bacterium]